MLRCYVNENTTIVLNQVESPVCSLSCFVNRGMKDDAEFINGTAHLTEHMIAKSICLNNQPYAFSNANIDKEYTCFYGQSLSLNFVELFNAIINIDIDFSYENLEREKRYIWSRENNKILSNFKLLDLEKMEYNVFGENNKLHMPTLITKENFFKIDEQMVKCFLWKNIQDKRIMYFISANFNRIDLESSINKLMKLNNQTVSMYDKNLIINFTDEDLDLMRKKNTLQIKTYVPKFFMSAFKIDDIKTIDDFMVLNCLTVLYRTFLNKCFEKASNILIDVSLKNYNETTLLMLYSKKKCDIYKMLMTIDINDYLLVLDNIKRSLLFSLIEKITNPIEYHKFQFKTLNLFDKGNCFNIDDLQILFEKITIDRLISMHQRCLDSEYYQ